MIIGIIGSIGSGKTTSCDYLIEEYHLYERSFAYPLKKACQELFSLNDSQVFGDYIEKEKNRYERFLGKDVVYTEYSFEEFAKNPKKIIDLAK